MTRAFMITLLLGITLSLMGLAAPQDQAPSPPAQSEQRYCPVTPEEEIDPEIFTHYNGIQVYFCCNRCRIRFTREPQRYEVQLLSASTEGRPNQDGHDDDAHEHTHGDHEHADAPPTTEQEHEHAHDAPPAESQAHDHSDHAHADSPRWVQWLGKFHPAATDFPIALLVAAAVAELLFMARKRPFFDNAGRFCLWGAALTGVVAAVLGWCFGGFTLVDADRLLLVHRWLGTSAALLLVVLFVLSERARRAATTERRAYRSLLFATTLLVLGTAFVGGAMVWGLDHYLP